MKVLLTACNYFGSYDLVRSLRILNPDIKIIGTDINSDSAMQRFVDTFYIIPSGKDREFITELFKICQKEKPDVILPGSSYEVYALSLRKKDFENIGVKVLVSEPEPLEIALNKQKTYNRLKGILVLPEYFYAKNGYCVKPTEGKGARGIQYNECRDTLIMDKLDGEEIDVDVLSYNKEVLLVMCKIRKRAYGGTLVEGELVYRPYIEKQIEKIIQTIPLQYLSVIQFIGGKLLEINPRIAGAMFYPETWNMPDLAIKLSLGQITAEDVKKYQDKIPFGTKLTKTLVQYEYK